jgi:putative ABC transport system permease protein
VRATRAFVVALLAIAAAPAIPVAGDAAPPSILVSRQLLEAEGLQIGQVVSLALDPAGADARAFRIAGSYEPVPDPMRLGWTRHEARLHLPDMIALDPRAAADPLRQETVSRINVALDDPSRLDEVARTIETRMPLLAARPTRQDDEASSTFAVLERFHLAIAVVTLAGSSAFLVALMIVRAEERRETAAILRLLGVPRHRILGGVLVEGLVIAVAGGAFGVLVALAIQGGVNRFFQWRFDTALVFLEVSPRIAWRTIALAVPLGTAASLVASWILLRGRPSAGLAR